MAGRVFMEFIIEFIALFAASNKALLLFSSGLCGDLLPLLVPKKEPGTDSYSTLLLEKRLAQYNWFVVLTVIWAAYCLGWEYLECSFQVEIQSGGGENRYPVRRI